MDHIKLPQCQSNPANPSPILRQPASQVDNSVRRRGTSVLWGPTAGFVGGRFRPWGALTVSIWSQSDANLMPIHRQSDANSHPIDRQSGANPIPIQCYSQSAVNQVPIHPNPLSTRCQFSANPPQSCANLMSSPMPIHCQSIANPSQSYVNNRVSTHSNMMPIWCQSSANQVPIWCQSSTNLMSTKRRSISTGFQSDANLVPIQCQ